MSSHQITMVSLDELVSLDHQYRKFKTLFNFKGIEAELLAIESEANYKGHGILRLFKCLLLQFMEDLSDRELERYLADSNAGKWFCDFALTEKTPDHSVFSKIRKKIGTELLSKIFTKFRDQLRSQGYMSEVFTFVDASYLISKASLWEERDELRKQRYDKLNNETLSKVARDKQAKIGCKGGNKFWYGYKKHVIIERYAELKLAIGEHFYPIDQIGIKFYYLEQKAWVYCNAEEFIHKFWHVTPHSHNINQFEQFLLHSAWQEGIITFTIGLFTAISFFMYRGKKAVIQDKIRGADFVEASILAKMLYKNKQAANICFSGLPLVKNSERRHILITGTTGSGKTNMLNELLPQIRKERGRAIIVDLTGSFTDRFFDPKCDKILNPLQENNSAWLPWNDCHEIWDFNDMASNFSNYNPKLDDFFAKSAELVLAEGLRLYQDSKDIKRLVNTILYANNKEFVRIFKNSAVSGIISSSAPETSSGIQATVSKNIEALQHLKPKGEFSIRKWFTADKGWLFITSTPNQRVMLRPLIAAWISIAIKALMNRNINNTHSNMWFVIDELPALQKISSLPIALAESRKYGGCVVAGMQNIHQLEEIYGHAGAASMLDLFGSKFIFRVSDQQTAHKSALMLGEQEIIETQESLSYGANSMRDGVNMHSLEKRKLLVMPSEIMNLPDLTCYVKLVGNFPITKLQMNLQT